MSRSSSESGSSDEAVPSKNVKPDVKIAEAYTVKDEGTYSVTLVVEGVKLYVIGELLARVSDVFKKMLTGEWKEAKSKEILLPEKSLQAIVWLLDFAYPHIKLKINEEKAMTLLPLAVEYQIKDLQKLCEHHLAVAETESYRYNPPIVRMLKISEELNLENFKCRMINKCAALLTGEEIDRQWSLPENKGIPDKCYHQIIRKRLRHHDQQQRRRTSDDFTFQPQTVYAEGVNQGEKYRTRIVSEEA